MNFHCIFWYTLSSYKSKTKMVARCLILTIHITFYTILCPICRVKMCSYYPNGWVSGAGKRRKVWWGGDLLTIYKPLFCYGKINQPAWLAPKIALSATYNISRWVAEGAEEGRWVGTEGQGRRGEQKGNITINNHFANKSLCFATVEPIYTLYS